MPNKHGCTAKTAAECAAAQLVGSSQTRAVQLVEQIECALSWAQRVEFYVRVDDAGRKPPRVRRGDPMSGYYYSYSGTEGDFFDGY